MAKKFNTGNKPVAKSAPAPAPARTVTAVTSTPVRNSAVPKTQPTARKDISREMIARRAFEIFASGKGGSQDDNWHRAERELRGL
ncbi:MAG TPA: DUF2934 domain-containing protein [Tepidisphaeraceae bacterium]